MVGQKITVNGLLVMTKAKLIFGMVDKLIFNVAFIFSIFLFQTNPKLTGHISDEACIVQRLAFVIILGIRMTNE